MGHLTPVTFSSRIAHLLSIQFADLSDPAPASDARYSSSVESRSLLASLRRSALTFAALWQTVVLLAAVSTLGTDAAGLALAIALVGAGSVVARMHHRLDIVVATGMAITGFWGYIAGSDIESTLVFAAAWQINFASCIAGILLLRRYGVPYTFGLMGVLIVVAVASLPEWDTGTLVSTFITQAAIIVAVRWGMTRLVAVASEADTLAGRESTALRDAQVAENVSKRLSEEGRVLHDTAINTLGAIANGRAIGVGHQQVREQCRRDVELLDTLQTRPDSTTERHLDELFRFSWFPVRRRGLLDAELDRCSRHLPVATRIALIRIAREAVTNAGKHSGADHATVDVRIADNTLTVTVSDTGRGFEPNAPSGGRGLEQSIIVRARENGIRLDVDSRPGKGTRITLVAPLDYAAGLVTPNDDGPDPDALRNIGSHGPATPGPGEGLFQRASELWAIGLTAIALVLTAAGSTNEHLALFPMIAVMASSSIAYALMPGFSQYRLTPVFLAAATVVVFLLAATAVEFGGHDPIHWQALAPTGPFVLLLATTTHRRSRIAATSAWLAATVLAALAGWSVSATAAQIVIIAGAVGIGFCALWAVLEVTLARQGEENARAERDIHDAVMRTELMNAAQQGRQRWMDAGLEAAITLLNKIADGRLDPDDPTTRGRCGDEERYLRQLVQLNPKLVNLTRALPSTLAYARDKGISYHLLLGDSDTPDEATATVVATRIRQVLAALPRGNELRVSLFTIGEALQLTLVGAGITLAASDLTDANHANLGSVDLVELQIT